MMYADQSERKPEVLGARSLGLAFALHAAAFLLLYLFAMVHLKPKEIVMPIDLSIVVNENLDGDENEPPPLNNVKPPEPKPAPKPEPAPEPPKVDDKVEAVETIVEKPKPKPEKKVEPKKEPEKKPEPPKKTKKELDAERIERMRKSATVVNKPVKIEVKNQPSGNGRTEKQTMTEAQIREYLNMGYKPGTTTQLASSVEQYCISRIKQALDDRWRQMSPQIGREGVVQLEIRFDGAGRIVHSRITKSCGDKISDNAAYSVVRSVTNIQGLVPAFLSEYSKKPLPINYKVEVK